jgi:protein-tyrosine phosphatase
VARPFETAWFDTTDLVVCLDRGHQQTLLSLARGRAGDDRHLDRLVMLRSFDPRAGGAVDVPDPYYGDDAEFDACLDLVEAGCRGLTASLVDQR